MAIDTHQETRGFQAEVAQLLHLMIHSLYSNKEIFLRELISNASDAIDRLRFAALSDGALLEGDTDYAIHVSFNEADRTITITDNGIGMTRDEVVENIGTIARSGTREFLQSLTGDQQKDANLIGQFGVGFYSSFVVADQVTLQTRHAGEDAQHGVQWQSDGQGEYTLESVERSARGTTVTLHLRADDDEFLNGYRLRTIIRKYSDHIVVPIFIPKEEKSGDNNDEAATDTGDEQVNRASALWARPRSEITEDEYNELYKHIGHDMQNPLAYLHSRMEGTHEYILLLYIPAQAPFDMWMRDAQHGVKLYVRRVFIMDDAEKLMPRYLRFVRGIVDSQDLPLNVSREILQQNKLLDSIRTSAVKKVLGLLGDLSKNEPEKYATFWKEFGRAFKEGLIEDYGNRETIASLMRFASTHTGLEDQTVSLDDYIGRMKEGQDKVYFLAADSFAAAKGSPLLEVFTQKNVEVLLLYDRVDSFVSTELEKYHDIELQSVAKGEIDLTKLESEAEKEEHQKSVDAAQPLVDRLQQALKDRVKEVRVTTRLTSSPACLVVDESDIDPALQRLMKAAGQPLPSAKPIMEINPQHVIITKLSDIGEDQFGDWAEVLFDQSLLSLGTQLEDPIKFVNTLNKLLAQ